MALTKQEIEQKGLPIENELDARRFLIDYRRDHDYCPICDGNIWCSLKWHNHIPCIQNGKPSATKY
jgi:hypothetical protein